jgi:hypothetical protein
MFDAEAEPHFRDLEGSPLVARPSARGAMARLID